MQPRIKQSQLILYMLIFVAAPSLTYLIGTWIDHALGLPMFPVFPLNIFLGASVMILGLNLGIKATRQLYHAGLGLPWGEAAREVETQRLVVDGIYAYSRNPMVLGYSLLPVGMGLMFRSIGMTISITPIVLLLNYFIVKTREEPRLIERFGDQYNDYKSKTPFLFPNIGKLLQGYLIPYIRAHRDQLTYVALAELSLIVTSLYVFNDNSPVVFSGHSYIARILFGVICFLGIIAGVAPKWCTFASKGERRGSDGVAGHHPDCGHFPGHTIGLGERVYCAGCSGLVIGACLALLGLFSGFYPLDLVVGFWFGVLLVGLGLAQHFIDLGSGWLHFWLNLFFVLGAWFMFMAIQLMSLGFFVSAYFLVVTVFWIYARIRASQWIHVMVCSGCGVKCRLCFE